MSHIAFIGGGNMATSIIGGLIKEGDVKASSIQVSDPSAEQRQKLTQTFGVSAHADNLSAIERADVVILAVKPQVMKTVLEALRSVLEKRQPLIISIAAGISVASLEQWTGCKSIVRCMPNTPALLGLGATGLFGNKGVSFDQRNDADSLLRAVGLTVWVKTEAEIDAVTAVSGSGPAYFFLLMEAMIAAGKDLGLSEQTASRLTLQTALGAAQMALNADVDAAELRRRVTSPGGTTERAIATFEEADLRTTVSQALKAASDRAAELSRQLAD